MWITLLHLIAFTGLPLLDIGYNTPSYISRQQLTTLKSIHLPTWVNSFTLSQFTSKFLYHTPAELFPWILHSGRYSIFLISKYLSYVSKFWINLLEIRSSFYFINQLEHPHAIQFLTKYTKIHYETLQLHLCHQNIQIPYYQIHSYSVFLWSSKHCSKS